MKLTAKTLYGLENVLAEELSELGAGDIRPLNRAVLFTGSKAMLYKVNYCSRCALSILMPFASFTIRSKEELYRRASETDWSSIMSADQTFSVVPVVNSELFSHTGYPGLIIKDVIADHFRSRTGKRPSVNTNDPDIIFNLHISHDRVTISLDSSGPPLYKRGYRVEQTLAPLNEVLAAGILRLSGWDGTLSLTDPMCGSGTILIEAGLMAGNIPPGRFRRSFGFSRWIDYDESLFIKVKSEYDGRETVSSAKITGSDISEDVVRQAEANIRNAGLSGFITLEQSDIKDIKTEIDNGYVIFNPPYGERMKPEDLGGLYSMIGTTMKHRLAGKKVWIITSGKENLRNIGLKPYSKHILFNGALESILAGYEIYEGTRKKSGD